VLVKMDINWLIIVVVWLAVRLVIVFTVLLLVCVSNVVSFIIGMGVNVWVEVVSVVNMVQMVRCLTTALTNVHIFHLNLPILAVLFNVNYIQVFM